MDETNGVEGAEDESTLLCWGCGEFGQHCQGHTNDVSFPEAQVNLFGRAASLGAVSAVACGASHTAVLTDTGEVYVWGNGNSGQLGCGDQNPRFKPSQVNLTPEPPDGSKVRALACGSRHTMVLLDNGYVYSFGNNFYAQLGYNFREKNYKENQLRPQFLEFLKHRPVKEVSCGDKHSLFLFEDGTVAAVGNNSHGQMGDGTRAESTVPKHVELEDAISHVVCGSNHNLVITENGDVYAWGYGKACGKRREDVLVPEQVDFKGRQIRQVAGGSTHSLALTAGGKVYAWGFGTDGQLGMGSIVMATKPRRLRHGVLEEGVSCVACGDSFSAVVTVSGRLYMWGKNSHTIEGNQGSLHKVIEPYCLNPEPANPVRHVVCGAWHAAAVSGTPDPLPDRPDSDSENDDADTGSIYSSLSSNSLQGEDTANKDDTNEKQKDGVEVSAPPQSTSQNSPATSKRPPFVPRAKTKLTIGEFYATSESSRSEKDSSPDDSNPQRARSTGSKKSQSSGKSKVVVVEVPAAPLDPESDVEEPLPVSTQEDVIQDDDNDDRDDDDEFPFTSSKHQRDDYHLEESETSVIFPLATETNQNKVPKDNTATSASKHQKAELPAVECKAPSQVKHGDGVARPPPFSLNKARTTFMTNATPTVQVSKMSARNYALPREQTVLVSKHMDILDASQLLTSSGPDRPTTKSGTTPGRPYGVEHNISHHYYDSYGASLFSSLDWDDFDDDFLTTSPRVHGKDVTLQQVPLKQLDGDFGAKPDGSPSASKPPLSNTDLDWLDKLLLQRVISMGPQVKRSSTFFGALSGHMSRSPTKFFRRPTPSGTLSRTPSTMTFHHSHTPSAPAQTPFGRYKTSGAMIEGARKAEGGGGGGSRPGTRGLGAGLIISGVDSPRSDDSRDINSGLKSVKFANSGNTSPQRGPSGNIQNSRRGSGKQGSTLENSISQKAPMFSSATSWRQRQSDFPDDWSDTQSQSAPTSSKTRKQVAFADGGHAPRSVSVTGGCKPTLGAAMAAVTPIVSVKPAVVSMHSGRSNRRTSDADHETASSGHMTHGGESVAGIGAADGHPHPVSSVQNSAKSDSRKSQPTLAYRSLNESKHDPPKKTAANPHSQGRSVGLKSLLGGSSHAALTPVSGQGRSKTQLLISGAGDRNRRAHFN